MFLFPLNVPFGSRVQCQVRPFGSWCNSCKSGSWPHSLKCCTGQSSFAPKRLVFSSQFYLYTSLQEFYHLRTNLQKSCSLWAKQQERPWIEGSGSGMYSCTQRPDSNTQAQVLPSSFRGFEERKKKQNTLYKAVDSGWSWKIKVVKQVPWTTRYLLGFIAGACATLPFTTSALQCAGTGWNWLRCCLCAPRQVLLCRIWQSMIEWVHRDFPLEISSRV